MHLVDGGLAVISTRTRNRALLNVGGDGADGGRMRSREAAAYHEAGHFIARTVLLPDVWCMRLSIVPGGSVLGGSPDPGEYPLDIGPVQDRAEAVAIELFAGAAAEIRYTGDADAVEAGACADSRQARAVLRVLRLDGGALEDLEQALRRRAAKLVDEHWADVELVAQALLAHETLSGEEAEELLLTGALSTAPRDHLRMLDSLPQHRSLPIAPKVRAKRVSNVAARRSRDLGRKS